MPQVQIIYPHTKFHIEPEGTTSLGRKKKLINNSGIPQHEIEHIARCILPDILASYLNLLLFPGLSRLGFRLLGNTVSATRFLKFTQENK